MRGDAYREATDLGKPMSAAGSIPEVAKLNAETSYGQKKAGAREGTGQGEAQALSQ